MSAHLHDHPFKFYRVRGGSKTRIYPHAGARLHFGSREADSLSLPTLPVGTLASGDKVEVSYLETTVFLGTVEKRVLRKTGGSEQTETVTVLGPWSKMARLVYRQSWSALRRLGADADPVLGSDYSSRLILNETAQGLPQDLDSELAEIAEHAATACGYAVGDIDVSEQVLPSDECRDITVADAIRRELRLFPKAVARFDYSSGTPTLVIDRGQSANYAVADRTEREIEYDGHPITGVDLQIDTSGEIDGVSYLSITHQKAGDVSAGNPDCLYATLQVRGASSNTVRQSFKSVTEAIPGDLNSVGWWRQKHPRLEKVAPAAIKSISEGTRTPSTYDRISAATAGELEEAGLKCEVSKFSCKATIETEDDKEEDIYLTAHFLTTNATGTASDPKTYTWISQSSTESGEWVPDGLAEAILAERCGSIRSEKMTIRLGETFPAIGDTITDEGQTLPLQSFDVDCADLTADLFFGAPEYLSPEDMAALLSNFRNKRTTSSSTVRKTGKKDDGAGADVQMGGIPPLSSTEFQPGTKAHTTIRSASGSGGSIDLDSSKLDGGEKVEVHKLTVKASKEGEKDREYKILGTEDVEINPNGTEAGVKSVNGLAGALNVIGGDSIEVDKVGENTIRISYVKDKKPDPEPEVPANPCDHPGDAPGGEGGVPAESGHAGTVAGGAGGGGGVPGDESGSGHAGDPCPDCACKGVPAE